MISGTTLTISYASNGVTTTYAVPFYFWSIGDLIVQSVDSGGVVTNLLLNTDYLVTGTPDAYGAYPNGGSIVFQPGKVPAAGSTIKITRHTARTQLDTYPDNNPFPATVTEHDFDKLTLIVQELDATGFLGVLAGPPSSGVVGQWFILTPFQAGGAFGMCCTVTGTPGTWNPFGLISL